MTALSRGFANLPIKVKILSGFAGVLLILALVAGLGLLRFQGVADHFGTYAKVVKVLNATAGIENGFLNLRRLAREVVLGGDPKAIDAVGVAATRTNQMLEALQTLAPSPAQQEKLREFAVIFGKFRAHLRRVTALRQEQDKLVETTMDPAGRKMLEELSRVLEIQNGAGNIGGIVRVMEAQITLMRELLSGGVEQADEGGHRRSARGGGAGPGRDDSQASNGVRGSVSPRGGDPEGVQYPCRRDVRGG